MVVSGKVSWEETVKDGLGAPQSVSIKCFVYK